MKFVQNIKQNIMKHNLLILPIFLLIMFSSSCRKETEIEAELVPIKESLKVEHFSFDSQDDKIPGSLLYKAIIINDSEQLKSSFEAWNLATPEVLKQFDYDKYTLLLRFYPDLEIREDIKHQLFRNKITDIYTYTIVINGKETSHEDDGTNNSAFFFFYTGILINKIASDSEIEAVQAISWR